MEIIKDVAILIIFFVMVWRKVRIDIILFSCALIFGLAHYMTPIQLSKLLFVSLISESTLKILGVLYLISLMEIIMRKSGILGKMVNSVKVLSGDSRIAMASLTAIVGLLPSPGGARFSAPLVDEAGIETNISNDRKAAINYYYRHVWEYFLPLYAAPLMAIEILQISITKFILIMLPYTIITALSGCLIFGRGSIDYNKNKAKPSRSIWYDFFEGISPIILVMLLVMLFNMYIILALFIVIFAMILYYKIDLKEVPKIIKTAFSPRLIFMIFSAIYLRNILQDSGSVDQLVQFFQVAGLNTTIIAIVFPFIISFLTGITLPGVTITLPVVISMSSPENMLAMASLSLASNMIGDMLSPVHLCFIMSVEHFKADFGRAYRSLIIPESIVMLFGLVYSYLM